MNICDKLTALGPNFQALGPKSRILGLKSRALRPNSQDLISIESWPNQLTKTLKQVISLGKWLVVSKQDWLL